MNGFLRVCVGVFDRCLPPPPQAILDVMVNLQFPLVETLWKSFWRFSQSGETESLSL